MLVYGDHERIEILADISADLARRLQDYCRRSPGLQRHGVLVDALIRAGGMAQGIADEAFARDQVDDTSAANDACNGLMLMLAEAAVRSWRSGFTDGDLTADWRRALYSIGREDTVRIRLAEGYAYYALYPESYIEAALASGLDSRTVVIGIRSIGTSLGAVVAAALGSEGLVTVRPKGHPFERRIELGPTLTKQVLADARANFAIVDEGPGLSGSSFASVRNWLVDKGVGEHRIHFFPSHGGEPGNQTTGTWRWRWSGSNRHHTDLATLILTPDNPRHGLEKWISDLVGPLDGPLTDISGGRWREQVYAHCGDWPPSDSQMERRKYIAQAGGERFLVKFAGLGGDAERKLEVGRPLAEAGFVPEPVGSCHGFIVQRWLDGRPLDMAELDRQQLISRIGDYLVFRARMLKAQFPGACLDALFKMAAFNIGEALGPEVGDRVKAWLGASASSDATILPVDTDNRMHAWEWFTDTSGRLIKADALDHSSAHDLIGCQDIAWDIAAAAVEFALSDTETAELAERVGRQAGRKIDATLPGALKLCYIGFQLGLWTYARANAPQESARISALQTRYIRQVRDIIG